MKIKEKQYRVLHHLLENPIFLDRIAYLYEALLDSQSDLVYRRAYLQKVRDERRIPPIGVMRRLCEAYRMEISRANGTPETRDIIDIESDLLLPYRPI